MPKIPADDLAISLQQAMRAAGERVLVDHTGNGWFRVRRPRSLSDGALIRRTEAEKRLVKFSRRKGHK